MNPRIWLPPAVLLCGAAHLLGGTSLEAFTTSGDALALDQRDFRVFNNFADLVSNDNQVPDPNFPGATGAVLALWKAVAEWGSGPHGLGLGDPSQPVIGSGGANFDATFQGLAQDPGGTDDNVMSALDGFGGGVLAFTELPTSDGWRIRFYENPTAWSDGPGFPSSPHKDLQGIAAHEYGHALGLGHSSVFGSTMGTFTSNGGVDLRSIEPDDIAGVQFIYGVKSPSKPLIESYSVGTAGQIEIRGQNFDAGFNEIWFTRATPGGDGTPVKLVGIPATLGGTQLDVTVPLDAGPGDVLVKAGVSTAFDALSNAFPFDPTGDPCVLPVAYGIPKPTSAGTVPAIEYFGLPSLGANDFRIGTLGGLFSGSGLLFSGPAAAAQPFYGGTLLVAPPWTREAAFVFNFFSVEVGVLIDASMVGTTRFYQLWFRDPGDPFGVGISDGLEVTFCP